MLYGTFKAFISSFANSGSIFLGIYPLYFDFQLLAYI